ncbi:MAG: hypothetical protein WAL71_06895 [Terriglobales bacterium]|jgi:uncharacterized protein YqiB (DUF1249 family)
MDRLIPNCSLRAELKVTRSPKAHYALDLRHARKFTVLITMQKTLAGMKPSCPVLNPMTHTITLLTAASAQPSQHRRPTKIVDAMVKTQDK